MAEKDSNAKKALDAKKSDSKKKEAGGIKKLSSNVVRSVKDMRGETKKIVWPTKKQVLNNTGVVITAVIVSSAFLGALDFVLKTVVNFLLGKA